MASFLDKFKINTALTEQTPLDLSCDHITTGNFMQLNIAWSKELVPKEKISVNMETFTRLQPMPVPTFGRARINNRAFFVPFRTIFPGWTDFITDVPHVGSNGTATLLTSVPTIGNVQLLDLFLDEGSQLANVYPEEREGAYDFNVVLQGSVGTLASGRYKITLTASGRRYYNHLVSLGYKIIWTDYNEQYYSALPLLAFAKVVYDWYLPSAYMAYSFYQKAEALFNKDVANYSLTSDDIGVLLSISTYVNYDSDYFVSAWDNPVNPNQGTYSDYALVDPTNGTSATYSRQVVAKNLGTSQPGTDNTPVLLGTANSVGSAANLNALSQWAIDALKSLTDYMKRHQLVGARALDRYMARFGVSLSSEKLKRSVYLGMGSEDIQFGDVMSHSDTAGAALGDYAGKGIGYGGSNFDFETDEYGMMIILSTILPKQGYYQGINRNVMHISKLDYFTPEFDNLGTQAISCAELYVPTDTTYEFWTQTQGGMLNANDYNNQVFGWTPRYAEYKVGHDMISGDFIYNGMNVGMDSWHTMRTLNYSNADQVYHDRKFVEGRDADQYNRIFYNTSDNADKFNIIYHFDIKSWSPMKSLFDTYEFEDKGKKVTVEANGVKMN